jgi:hypothetical protein
LNGFLVFVAVAATAQFDRLITVPPLPWAGAKVGYCYHNVREMVRRHGGEICYGWAVADCGPHRLSQIQEPPPLYRRYVNHVVWRNPQGELFEVTPGKYIIDHTKAKFIATDFLPCARTTTEVVSQYWFGQRCRYVALRSEGEKVAELLNRAQASPRDELPHYLQQALEALREAGFQPHDWKVEAFGERIGSIWLIAQ